MDWMGDWLKQIVLLVLIATFVDLLLPNHSMERYVKLVMGLLIIMAILSPVLQLFREHIDFSNLSFSDDLASHQEMMSLAKIQEEGERVQAKQQEQIHGKTEKTIENWIHDHVSKKFSVKVVSADVKIKPGPTNQSQVKSIQVSIIDAGQELMIQPIRPIDPIDIEKEDQNQPSSEHPSSDRSQSIRKYVAETWSLTLDQVQVKEETSF